VALGSRPGARPGQGQLPPVPAGLVLSWVLSVQGQVGWSSEHPGLVGDVPAHGRGVEPDDLQRSLPTQAIL